MDKPGVLLVAAMDTKGQEALYIKACLEEALRTLDELLGRRR